MALKLNSARFDRSALPHFCYGDNKSLFMRNFITQPEDWPWRHSPVQYNLNSQGFRCPEWDSIDWANSILCFGCSMTFGVGVNGPDTWVEQLGKLTGLAPVNLGWPGASVSFIWANTLELQQSGIRPRAVVYYWPDALRVAEFIEGREVYNWGVWDETQPKRPWAGSLGKVWLERDYHALQMARYQISSVSWTCPVLHLTWAFDDIYQDLAQHLHILEDYGRDLGHPGPRSHGLFAQQALARLRI